MTLTSIRRHIPSSTGVHRVDRPDPRRSCPIGGLALEAGGHLPDIRVSFETWGTLHHRAHNAVLVEHALTGDSHVAAHGDLTGSVQEPAGWWQGLIGPGRPIDTDRWFVVACNVLGGCHGTTGPSSAAPDGQPWGSRFPFVTVRDQVRAESVLADRLGIDGWAAVLGGSMGGMRTLEWAVGHPGRVERALVLASTAAATAEQIAWCQAQLLAIRQDPAFHGGDYYGRETGPELGLALARRIAQVTYRSERELEQRFGREPQTGEHPFTGQGRYAVESYLDHHGHKLAARFDANSYLVLTEAMSSHDVGRGRGGVGAALRRFTGQLTVAPVDSDRLYPAHLSRRIIEARGSGAYQVISSAHGHDGFLLESAQVGAVVRELLAA